MVETALFAFILIWLGCFTCLFIWFFISVLWMEHQLYQGIVCVAQKRKIELCKETVLRQIKKLNLLGEIKSLKIKENQAQWKGYIHWSFYNRDFFIQQSFQPP